MPLITPVIVVIHIAINDRLDSGKSCAFIEFCLDVVFHMSEETCLCTALPKTLGIYRKSVSVSHQAEKVCFLCLEGSIFASINIEKQIRNIYNKKDTNMILQNLYAA